MASNYTDYLDDLPGYLTTRQFAEKVGLNKHTIALAVAEGRIEAFRLGTIIAIPETEVERFRNRKKIHGTIMRRAAEIAEARNVHWSTAYRWMREGYVK